MWIKDLYIKPDKLNLIEEKVGKSLGYLYTGKIFPNRKAMAQALRSTIDKWDLIKLKSFCKAKDTLIRTKWQPTDCEKILTNAISDRWLISKICNELKKIDSRK